LLDGVRVEKRSNIMKQFLRQIIVENYQAKLISLLLATLVWFIHQMASIQRHTVHIPLEVRDLPASMSIVKKLPSYLPLQIAGREDLTDIPVNSLRYRLTLASAAPGTASYPITLVGLEEGQEAFILERRQGVSVTIAEDIDKLVEVKPQIEGKPATVHLVKITSIPPQIKVRGSSEILKDSLEIKTEPLDISKLNGNRIVKLAVQLPEGINSDTKTVLVVIDTDSPDKAYWRAFNRPVVFPGLPLEYAARSEPAFVNLVLKGERGRLLEISENTIVAAIEDFTYDQVDASEFRFTASVRTEEIPGLETDSISPDKVDVFLTQDKKILHEQENDDE